MIGVAFQIVGCSILSLSTFASLMVGLAIFLTGSGLNVTCMNGMVTQLFTDPEGHRRERAFLWNYSGMNVGFFIGFTIAGFFQKTQNYGMLFLVGGMASFIAILTILLNWHKVRDRETYLTATPKNKRSTQMVKAFGIIILVLIALLYLLKYATLSNDIIIIIAVLLVIMTAVITIKRKDKKERNRLSAFILFLFASFVFWTLYQLAPIGPTLFIQNSVNLNMFGTIISPQWVNNINTFVIVVGGPLLGVLLIKLRAKGYKISLPFLFSLALVLIGVAFIILPIGIHLATTAGIVSFSWIFWCYILQSLGELCISPIGYAMIGKMIPRKLQGIMMGLWCMTSGIGGIAAGRLSNIAIVTNTDLNPLATNHGYAMTFGII